MTELISYIEWKIRVINRYLKHDGIGDKIDALEYFLVTMNGSILPLEDEKVKEIVSNLSAFRYVIHNYEILNNNELKYFEDKIRRLARKDPGFTSYDYKELSKLIQKIINKLDTINSSYVDLIQAYEDIKSADDKLLYDKMLLEYTKNDIENERLLSDKMIFNYIKDDPDIDVKQKQRLLLKLIDYNENAMNNYIPMNLLDVKKLLEEYGYSCDDNNSLEKIISMYKLSVLKDIMQTIKELNIKFNDDVLIKILECGTSIKTIKEAFDRLNDNESYSLTSALNIPTFWIENSHDLRSTDTFRSSIIRDNARSSSSSQSNDAINSEETFETAEYLKSFEFYNPSFAGMHIILSVPVSKIQRREKMLSLYEISRDMIKDSTTLLSSNSVSVLDQFIELGEKDYIFGHLATISRSKKLPFAMYILKKDGVSPSRITDNDIRLIGDVIDLNNKYTYEELSNEIGLSEFDLQDRSMYDDILSNNNPNKISPLILNNPVIKYIEENNKISSFEYKFGDIIISRKKVLRIATSLLKDNYITYDAFKYIITYNSIFNKEDLDKLEENLRMTYAFALGRRI